jgi:AcrR family transcriptional regulator
VLSRDVIVDAAMEVLDAEGLDAVTMRRVADALGTGPASLYAHVQHKDDLVDALLDRVIGEIDITAEPDPARWQEQLKQFARDGRAIFARHNDIARAALGNIPTGPHALPVVEWMLSVVRAGGASDQVAAWTADVFSLYLTATAYEESLENAHLGPAGDPDFHEQVHAVFQSLPAAQFPHIHALGAALTSGDREERFEFGLDMILRGIASTIERPTRRR